LSSSLSSHLAIETTTTVASDGQFQGLRLARFHMRPGMPRRDAERDLAIVRPLNRPAAKSAVAPLVAVLKARTKSANAGSKEDQFAAEVMVEDLSAYPLDVVEWVCNYWIAGGDRFKWFPCWVELRELCEDRARPRRLLQQALEWVVAGEPENFR
jgi:hypothetical protein